MTRFDPLTYLKLTEIMDSHDVGAFNRGGVEAALRSIQCPVLILGMNTDLLYPIIEQQTLAASIPTSKFEIIDTVDGHDGFLLEQEQVGSFLKKFLES